KSTLLRLLLGLQPPAAGSLQVLGKRPLRGNPQIGYVPQRRNIDPDLPVRGRDFVHLGIDGNRWGFALGNAASNRQRVEQAIASVEALAYADRPLGRPSAGRQQRVRLAVAPYFGWDVVRDVQELLRYAFMQHAYEAGTIVALSAGIIGYFVVLRGLSFAAHALSHIGFAGATGAVVAGATPIVGLLVFT